MKQCILNRACLFCGDGLYGRADKLFCNSHCRNSYHNQLKNTINNYKRKIKGYLSRNHHILEELLTPAAASLKVSRKRLQQLGFRFNYHTHVDSSYGSTCYYCYDYGYLPLNEEWCLLVKENAFMGCNNGNGYALSQKPAPSQYNSYRSGNAPI